METDKGAERMSRSARISADTEVCLGAGNCVSAAPGIFSQTGDGTVVVERPEVQGEDVGLAQDAADNCPAFALLVELFDE
jgi:ferredoxin